MDNVFLRGSFIQPVAVEIDGTGMMYPPQRVEPIAVNRVAVRIEATEERIGESHLPDIIQHFHPLL